MCGICGFATPGHDVGAARERIAAMVRRIRHRGPDGEGCHVDAYAALGHTRLSIIDLATGQQPIYNEDRSLCISFNGEIYNYLDLRRELIAKGHRFTTHSDTEVILHLYEERGEECVTLLRGMFAFAIWDARTRTLFLARDRLGIKPLYLCAEAGGLAFASEIKALLVARTRPCELNVPSVDQYLALNYTVGPQTMIQGIDKLMPGHWLHWRDGVATIRRYWDFDRVEPSTAPLPESRERLGELIDEVVRLRLMSEVPLGAFLSGGVDSSVIVAVMSRLTGKPVKTFTVGYRDAGDDNELEYAGIVARRFGTEHHEFLLDPATFMDVVPKVVWHLDEPVAEFATIPLLLLSELAKKHVTVMLSGEGADEIFAGYPIYRSMNAISGYQRLPRPVRHGLLDPVIGLALGRRKEGKYREWLRQPLERRYLGNGSYFTGPMRERLYTPEFAGTLDRDLLYRTIDDYYGRVGHRDAIGRMLYLDTKTWLPEDLLVKADKMTMAAAIELRVPFLDHRLVEFAAALPSRMKASVRTSKLIFKQYAETLLPREIVHRPKRGFPVPVKRWLRGPLRQCSAAILFDERTRRRGIFNTAYIERLYDRHAAESEDFSKNLWNLVILELWMRTFLDGDAPGSEG